MGRRFIARWAPRLPRHGHACPPQHVTRKVIGLSLDEAMAALIPQADHAALSRTYKDAFIAMRGAGEVEEPLYDGMVDLLDTLKRDAGCSASPPARAVAACALPRRAWHRRPLRDPPDRRPQSVQAAPGMALAAMAEAGAVPEQTVFIGDTGWDMGCARAAGCGAIGVGWGYHDHDEMIAMGAHDVADTPADIAALANKWVNG